MNRAAIYDQAWRAIDDAIVRGIRRAREPIPAELVPVTANVVHLCTVEQLREALARLEDRGLIRRRQMTRRDPCAPLFGVLTYTAYEATGVTP